MADVPTSLPESHLGSTLRRDAWRMEILPVVVVLGGFGIYATLRALEGEFYSWGPYLSPFYSPLIDPGHHWWRFSPALLILAGPLGFARNTVLGRMGGEKLLARYDWLYGWKP